MIDMIRCNYLHLMWEIVPTIWWAGNNWYQVYTLHQGCHDIGIDHSHHVWHTAPCIWCHDVINILSSRVMTCHDVISISSSRVITWRWVVLMCHKSRLTVSSYLHDFLSQKRKEIMDIWSILHSKYLSKEILYFNPII